MLIESIKHSPFIRVSIFVLVSCAVTLGGCATAPTTSTTDNERTNQKIEAPKLAADANFTDVTRTAGLTFVHNNGAFGERLMPESVGSGAALFDYDNDGDADIFLVNSRDWTDAEVRQYEAGNNRRRAALSAAQRAQQQRKPRRNQNSALYRNNGDGTFTDVSRGSGLEIAAFGMGATAGDYDNDGLVDLYLTGWGRNYLFHNQSRAGKARFVEVAQKAGVQDSGWSTSAAWVDYDGDERLDLFVCHYIHWTPREDVYASRDGKRKSYTGPLSYQPEASRLYRNLGNGRFSDVSKSAGISQTLGAVSRVLRGGSLGVAVCDYNGDKRPDLMVTNDQRPNYLFRNRGDGTFAEVAVESGIAYSEAGQARAGMGVDSGDIDGSGEESILIGNYSDEMLGLYRNRNGVFADSAPRSPVGQASRKLLTFGCALVDVNNDGWLDIFAANGHVDDDESNLISNGVTYKQPPLLLMNVAKGRFEPVKPATASALSQRIVARGLAVADFDLDGDVDVLMTINGAAPLLLRNDGVNASNALRLELQGEKSNRNGLGARIVARVGKQTLSRWVRSGSSYLCSSELPLTLGLGTENSADITIEWPSGKRTQLKAETAGQVLRVHESRGVIERKPLIKQTIEPGKALK